MLFSACLVFCFITPIASDNGTPLESPFPGAKPLHLGHLMFPPQWQIKMNWFKGNKSDKLCNIALWNCCWCLYYMYCCLLWDKWSIFDIFYKECSRLCWFNSISTHLKQSASVTIICCTPHTPCHSSTDYILFILEFQCFAWVQILVTRSSC